MPTANLCSASWQLFQLAQQYCGIADVTHPSGRVYASCRWRRKERYGVREAATGLENNSVDTLLF
jgi:hypothetical protein